MSSRGAITLLAVVLTVGCEGVDGDSLDLVQEYVAADDGFRVSYAVPPWHVHESSASAIELRVDLEVFGYGIEGSPPSHVFRMEYVESPATLAELFDIPVGETLEFDPSQLDPSSFDTEGLEDAGDWVDTEAFPETEGLPDDFPLPEGVDPDDVPEYLLDLDLGSPQDVALAEMRLLVDYQDAQLEEPLQRFETPAGDEGVVFQVIMNPGIFVRAYYLKTSGRAVRAVFASLFNLETEDVRRMAATLSTSRGGAR